MLGNESAADLLPQSGNCAGSGRIAFLVTLHDAHTKSQWLSGKLLLAPFLRDKKGVGKGAIALFSALAFAVATVANIQTCPCRCCRCAV
jgi:hypothetical protein